MIPYSDLLTHVLDNNRYKYIVYRRSSIGCFPMNRAPGTIETISPVILMCTRWQIALKLIFVFDKKRITCSFRFVSFFFTSPLRFFSNLSFFYCYLRRHCATIKLYRYAHMDRPKYQTQSTFTCDSACARILHAILTTSNLHIHLTNDFYCVYAVRRPNKDVFCCCHMSGTTNTSITCVSGGCGHLILFRRFIQIHANDARTSHTKVAENHMEISTRSNHAIKTCDSIPMEFLTHESWNTQKMGHLVTIMTWLEMKGI